LLRDPYEHEFKRLRHRASPQSSLSPYSAEQVRRHRHVVTRERPTARCAEVLRGFVGDGLRLGIDWSQVAAMLIRLLQVPPEQLVVLDGVARLQGAVPQTRPVLADRGVEDITALRVHGVI
jgi:hypothetical protein